MRTALPGLLARAVVVLTALWPAAGQADVALYRAAIEAERPVTPPPAGVTGITVPHHLVAADLMARGFWAASAGDYDRVILISPDHFRTLSRPFGVARDPIGTPFGPLPVDKEAVDRLPGFELIAPGAVAAEHGLTAVAPFIRHFWPAAKVVSVLAHVDSQPADWATAAEALAPLVTPRTLVVQSTDFSHYLPVARAVLRDQETLGLIAAGEADGIARADQPGHLDSKAAQVVQMRLQEGLGAAPVVIANRNQVAYGGDPKSTTSYVVAAWHTDPRAGAALRYPDQEVLYFAGDLLAGRYLTPVLRNEAAVGAIAHTVGGIVGGAPLIANFEGVLLDDYPVGLPRPAHVMVEGLAGPVLERLGVTVAGLANNHATDLGPVGVEETMRHLSARGISPLVPGVVADLGPLRVLALTMLQNVGDPDVKVDADRAATAACGAAASPPLVAYLHWGTEYTARPGEAQLALARALSECGVSAVIGHHSHRASPAVEAVAGGRSQMVYSLGNFLFDQSGERVSGALAEVRVFEQGTVAVRLVPLPNLFELGREAASK